MGDHILCDRYGKTRKCISSKAALMVLVWSFIIGLLIGLFLSPEAFLQNIPSVYSLIGYGCAAVILVSSH